MNSADGGIRLAILAKRCGGHRDTLTRRAASAWPREAVVLTHGVSQGPTTMATGGIQDTLARIGAVVRVGEALLTARRE